jgi:hypothetical protein
MGSPGFFSQFFGGIRSFFRWFFHRKLAMLIFFLLMLALPAYVLYITVFLPVRTAGYLVITPESSQASKDSTQATPSADRALSDTLRLVGSLELEKAYVKNRLALSQSDSVYMSVNLKDKEFNLEIKGVVVRACPIVSAVVSQRLSSVDHDQLLQWVSTPFDLQRDLSTIPKIPYVIKAAPKDTLEAQAQSSKPLPNDTSAVLFTLYFDRDLVVEIEQSEAFNEVDEELISSYYGIKDMAFRQEALQAAMHFRPPERDIYISLKVSAADARAIYRGIPVNATMALRLQ